MYKKIFENKLESEDYKITVHDTENGISNYYLCHTCKRHLVKGRLPPMAVANGLSQVKVEEDLNLTELENNLIAKKIIFQKVFKLPKTRMAAVKDRLVNIPIGDGDVLNTINCLPRTPSEAGLIEVKLKRKIEYKNYHQYEYISPEKIFKSLNYLKQMGNPHYQFFEDQDAFKRRCQNADPPGFDALFGNKENSNMSLCANSCDNLRVEYIQDFETEDIVELNEFLKVQEFESIDKTEKENDPARRFQIDYDLSTCLVQQYPECLHKENDSLEKDDKNLTEHCEKGNQLSFAPGEGKLPENILTSENWDALAFPMKHPDGKFNLHHKRNVKLNEQYYFVQRIRNKDPRFRLDPGYLFACTAYIEKKQLQRNINVSFMRGKKEVTPSGSNVYHLQDGFSVFDNISNTPTYWKKARMEMIAKLDNFGPFHFFLH